MKVFISSVRRGLEEERDALPGLIRALGHEPVRFEDFTAQPVPSREACLAGVAVADVYLLLLGSSYGDQLPETHKAPTEEEYTAALAKGIPRLAFRKLGADPEPLQAAFIARVEGYSTGLFRSGFTSAVDLQPKVVAALQDLPSLSDTLKWSPLPDGVKVDWRETWQGPGRERQSMAAVLDVHAVPVPPVGMSARRLRDIPNLLVSGLRDHGRIPPGVAIHADSDPRSAWAFPEPATPSGAWDSVRPEQLLGVRIGASGQRSAWQQLPADSLGSLLDEADLSARIGRLLRLLGALVPSEDHDWALALGLTPSISLDIGPPSSLGSRSGARMNPFDQGPIRVLPDEGVTAAALGSGADEVGVVMARGLLEAFQRTR